MVKRKLLKLKDELKKLSIQEDLAFPEYIKLHEYNIIKSSGLFNENYYYTAYPDVELCDLDPIEHYIKFGVDESCNPNDKFNTKYYLNHNPDIVKSEMNPFVHYILFGIHEGRTCNSNLYNLEELYEVSIIMPTFNRKNIISRAINSIINQTFQNFELIIIDDGSDDNTEEFIKTNFYRHIKLNKIKYYKINHKGVCYARNFGLKKATGNIIAYLDTDNEWKNNFLECMITELHMHEKSNCAYCEIHRTNKVKNTNNVLSKKFNRKELLKENFIDLNSFIHTKKLYDMKGGFDENLTRLVDWDLIIRYTENNNPLFVEKILVNYYIDPELNNISTQVPLDKNMKRVKGKYWRELYSEEYETIVDYFDQSYYLTMNDDVFQGDIHPIHHYLTKGYKEGRNPHPNFDTNYYKNKYSKILQKGLNPFVHYIKWGQFENYETNNSNKIDEIITNNSIYLSNYTFKEEPLVSIIILNKNGIKHLKRLFKDFNKKTNYSNFEIIVVDNASTDYSVKFLKSLTELPIKIIVNDKNVSFSEGNNDAVKKANGEYILLLNNDMEPSYGWLNEMMGTIIYNNNVGAVGAKLLYPFLKDDTNNYSYTIQHAGDIFREKISTCTYKAFNKNKFSPNIFDKTMIFNQKCLLVTGAALLTKKSIYQEIGGLDESFWYGYEDVDYNLRLYEQGYTTIFAPAALLFHHESATRKNVPVKNNHEVLCKKWSKFLFKHLLKDKIEKKYFFTDKKLSFLIITNHNLHENKPLVGIIKKLNKNLIKNEYETRIQLNLSNLNIPEEVDIIVSFTSDYPIEQISARSNIIKILVQNQNDAYFKHRNYESWDIIISNDVNLIQDKTMGIYTKYVNNFSKLDEVIISSLYNRFLNEKGD